MASSHSLATLLAPPRVTARLILEDGFTVEGVSFGAVKSVAGETVRPPARYLGLSSPPSRPRPRCIPAGTASRRREMPPRHCHSAGQLREAAALYTSPASPHFATAGVQHVDARVSGGPDGPQLSWPASRVDVPPRRCVHVKTGGASLGHPIGSVGVLQVDA